MKDIFVDENIAKNFANPLSDEYKTFVDWLRSEGSLVVSNKLITEYGRACQHSKSNTNIFAIIDIQTRDGRLNKKSNIELNAFKVKKHVLNSFRSNKKDHNHIKLVMISFRKYAISIDKDLRYDINNFPGINAKAVTKPSLIDYR